MTYLVRRLTIASGSVGLAALLFQADVRAQTTPTPAPAPAPTVAPAPGASQADPSISDRVKKDAASPLYWIRLNAQKNDSAAPAKPAPRITEVKPVAAAPRPTPAPPPSALPATSPPTATATAAAAPVNTPPTSTAPATSVASNGAGMPASTGAAAPVTPAPNVAANAAAALSNPAPQGVGAAAGLAAGAGMATPSAASQATEAARTATAPPEEPDDSPLALIKADEPEFPITVMRRLRKGTVQVRFDVMPDGSVSNAAVVNTTHRSLNEAALEAVAGWRFQPVRAARTAVVDLGFDLDS
ncbi:energy transducer TonB [Ideonella sp. DXS29W]|uniref:Energy transducer TonB n=1 Tax=Ideonella lacteola TaxID=2984193 RepID=A0ABU9BRE2_9BURK